MTRLILTADASSAGALEHAGCADLVIPIERRPPSGAELAAFLAPRAMQGPGAHWLDHAAERTIKRIGATDVGLLDLFQRFEAIELWVDPDPNSQLQLIWLLDYLADVAPKLSLIQTDASIGEQLPEELPRWRLVAAPIRNDHLETASLAWAAWRAPTPEAWFDLLAGDLSALPQLQNTVISMLEELPTHGSGLGATEVRMLELVSAGDARPFDVFPGHEKPNERRVFGYWEVGCLLDGLALCPAPAVAGLDEGPFTLEMHNDAARHQRYKQSRLSLTQLGEAILAGTDDFSRHNPVHRWWGGTELTNAHLWRWDPANHRALISNSQEG